MTTASPTSVALAYEQASMWSEAQQMYEQCQVQGRRGLINFDESEYLLWEDHWIHMAQKLQNWEILTELAQYEGNQDLFLECYWRLKVDWVPEKEHVTAALQVADTPVTPRRKVMEAYLQLVKSQDSSAPLDRALFLKTVEEGIQLTLKKWWSLPEIVSDSHIPLLQMFQSLVELQEAASIYHSLAQTDAKNLDQRAVELRNVLSTWRERLPNDWDDINIWSDLIAWRQHVFAAINRTYIPLGPQDNRTAVNPSGSNTTSHAYRGYHETAWITNKFAHVARKQKLTHVCHDQLNSIYTLPNIEIQEAFLKLREQAKCHAQNPPEMSTALETINNTNLMYFTPAQKAEFFTLKAMFLAESNLIDEANSVFNHAVVLDIAYPKAWAEWGEYHDTFFQEMKPDNVHHAVQACAAYLQAVGLYKNQKCRKLMARLLWYANIEEHQQQIMVPFNEYKGDVPQWYWITFIPQLLQLLSSKDPLWAKRVLFRIAKTHPQALFFYCRTYIEELGPQREKYEREHPPVARQPSGAPPTPLPPTPMLTQLLHDDSNTQLSIPKQETPAELPQASPQNNTPVPPTPRQPHAEGNDPKGHSWNHAEDIMAVLKTATPLLALTMEFIVDQISGRFKLGLEEDFFKILNLYQTEALHAYGKSASRGTGTEPPTARLLERIRKLIEVRLKDQGLRDEMLNDFKDENTPLRIILERITRWKQKYAAAMAKRGKHPPVESVSHWLVEFQYQKFDEIEVPGQYLKHEDNNTNFVRISHFAPKFDICQNSTQFYKRLGMIGHDGSAHYFAIQNFGSTGSHGQVLLARREEKFMQFLRLMNTILESRIESRKRNLKFHIPVAVPLATRLRLFEDDASIVSLQDIWEQHCKERRFEPYDPIVLQTERLRELYTAKAGEEFDDKMARMEIADEIAAKLCPDTILKRYLARTMPNQTSYWYLRKQITLHLAGVMFITYVLQVSNRNPSKIMLSRSKGSLFTTDILPNIPSPSEGSGHDRPVFSNDSDSVPWRFTPNLQTYVTPIGIEGPLVASILAIARVLTDHPKDIQNRFAVFVRDEIQHWYTSYGRPTNDPLTRENTKEAVNSVVVRARELSCRMERERANGLTPVTQTILELINTSTNPFHLAHMDATWYPWL